MPKSETAELNFALSAHFQGLAQKRDSSAKFRTNLSISIDAMFSHVFTPNLLLSSVITSIPKDTRGNICTSDNYGGISLCSALCKLIDVIIIDKYGDKLFTSELQFAFKKGHSTNMCTSVVKEVASHYNSQKTDVLLCMLDASQAFDRVHYGKLFELLRIRKIPATVPTTLVVRYVHPSKYMYQMEKFIFLQ